MRIALYGACAGLLLMACSGTATRPAAVPDLPPADPQAHDTAAADGYYALGRSQFAARRYDEALASYRHALRLDARHINARNGLAVLHAARGEYAQAITLWRTLLDESGDKGGPDTAFLFGNLGYAYYLTGQHEQAETALGKACLLDPLNAQSWQHLGMVLEALGQPDRAAAMQKQADTLHVHDLRQDYAQLRQERGSAPEADVRPAALAAGVVQAAQAAQLAQVVQPAEAASVVLAGSATPALVRLEISNGNGVTGMAARMARSLDVDGVKTVRLSNVRPFMVPLSRIEYQPQQQLLAQALSQKLGMPLKEHNERTTRFADMRIVLGRDLQQRSLK